MTGRARRPQGAARDLPQLLVRELASRLGLDPEWRLTARIVKRVRTFGEGVVARATIGTVEPVDYAQVSALAADVAALQDDVVGIDASSVKRTCPLAHFEREANVPSGTFVARRRER